MEISISHLRQTFQINNTELLQEIAQHGKYMRFPPGTMILNPGSYVKVLPLVLSGVVKVIQEDQAGKEVFLYYLEPGETCAMSLTCSSTQQPSQIKAITEDDTELIAVPIDQHDRWLHTWREWEAFVANTYATRFQALLHTIDSIAFKNMDERLIDYLRTKFDQLSTDQLTITHQEIANELGTSREVISRLLKQLERKELITLGRNRVMINKLLPQ